MDPSGDSGTVPKHTAFGEAVSEQEQHPSGGGGTILLRLLEFKTHLLEAVEELHIRRDAETRFEDQIGKLVLEKQELEWEKESLQHQLQTVAHQQTESLTNMKKQFQVKLRNMEEEKGKYQVTAELKDKEINNLKEELKSLQLLKYNLEKKSSELEQKLALQSRSKDIHLTQLGEVEKRFGTVSRQCAVFKQAHERLEQNVDEAMTINKKLTAANEKQEATIVSLKKELDEVSNKLIKVKMTSVRHEKSCSPAGGEQHIQQLHLKLNVETEMNKKLREENEAERTEKQEVMRSLQRTQQLLLSQTQTVRRQEAELQTQRETNQALKREHEAMQEKSEATRDEAVRLKESYDAFRTSWDKETRDGSVSTRPRPPEDVRGEESPSEASAASSPVKDLDRPEDAGAATERDTSGAAAGQDVPNYHQTPQLNYLKTLTRPLATEQPFGRSNTSGTVATETSASSKNVDAVVPPSASADGLPESPGRPDDLQAAGTNDREEERNADEEENRGGDAEATETSAGAAGGEETGGKAAETQTPGDTSDELRVADARPTPGEPSDVSGSDEVRGGAQRPPTARPPDAEQTDQRCETGRTDAADGESEAETGKRRAKTDKTGDEETAKNGSDPKPSARRSHESESSKRHERSPSGETLPPPPTTPADSAGSSPPGNKTYRSLFEWRKTLSSRGTAEESPSSEQNPSGPGGFLGPPLSTIPTFLKSKHVKGPSVITRASDLPNASGVSGTAASSRRRRREETAAVTESSRPASTSCGTSRKLSWQTASERSGAPPSAPSSESDWEASCSQEMEDQQSSFRAQISKIEQFLNTERIKRQLTDD